MNKSRGRPAGGRSDVRERIRVAAAQRFAEAGYTGTTLRAVAADCDVDVALISYYFGAKQGLFSAAMQLPVGPVSVLRSLPEGPVDPAKLLSSVIAIWEDAATGVPLRVLAQRALTSGPERVALRQYLESEVVAKLAERLTGRERERRARAGVYVLAGAVLGHYVLGLNRGDGPHRLFADLERPFCAALAEPARH